MARLITIAELERITAEWSVEHHGVATSQQLRELGWTAAQVKYRIKVGRWVRVQPGVVQLGAGPLTRRGSWLAAVLAAGGDAFLTGEAAADLWGLRKYPARRIDIVTTGAPRIAIDGVHVHRTRWMLAKDRRVRESIPVASPVRLTVDYAELADPYELVGLLYQLERRRMLDRHRLALVSRRLRNRRHGAAAMVFALEQLRAGSTGVRSFAELALVKAIRKAGLPLPMVNAVMHTARGRLMLDLWWPELGCCVEVDDPGHDVATTKLRDATRDEALAELGIELARVSNGQVLYEIDHCVDKVRELLRRSGWVGGS